MSFPILFEIYDYTNDKQVGIYEDYDQAEICCDEYVSNYGEPVEALVQTLD
jgi:hypothetical protein